MKKTKKEQNESMLNDTARRLLILLEQGKKIDALMPIDELSSIIIGVEIAKIKKGISETKIDLDFALKEINEKIKE